MIKNEPKTPENHPKTSEQEISEDFIVVSADENTRCPILEDSKKNKDFWLIKIPDNFDAKCLSGKTVVLNGVQDIHSKQNQDERFETVAKPIEECTSSLRVLIPSSSQETIWSAKSFKGSMSVVKSISIPPANTDSLPNDRENVQSPQIKPRWKPFGHEKPYKQKLEQEKNKAESETPKKKCKKKER